MDLHEVKDYAICATSAMREASNAAEIITRIHKILDMKIQIIDGSREAELINDVDDIATSGNTNGWEH